MENVMYFTLWKPQRPRKRAKYRKQQVLNIFEAADELYEARELWKT